MNDSDLKIFSPSDATHVEFIVQAQLQMALETENLKLDLATVRRGVQAVMDDPSKGKYFLAQKNDSLLGCLLTVSEWSDWRCGEVWWIHSVYVVPQARGQGVYRKMYEYIKELVMQNIQLRGLRLYVDKTNHQAQQVYEKLGMNKNHYELYEWMKTF